METSWCLGARSSAVIGCLAAFCVGEVFAHHVRVLDGKWVSDEVPPDSSRRFFIAEVPPPYQGEDRFPPSPALPAHNVGTGYCYSGLEFGGARGLWPGEGPQVRLRDEGEVTAWGRPSRAAWAEVRMPRPNPHGVCSTGSRSG